MENKVEITNNPNNINLDYDETSPITGNFCVILEKSERPQGTIEHRMCMESGYVTRTDLEPGSHSVDEYEKNCTDLMKKIKIVDTNLNSVWYPAFMQHPMCMLYAEGAGATPTDYSWSLSKVVSIDGEERLKYPVPGQEGEYYTSRLDVENSQKFEAYNFNEALDAYYKILQEYEDNQNKSE